MAGEYPDIESFHLYVDVAAMELARQPERFDVIVTENLFGDILSDLGASLQGGSGPPPVATSTQDDVFCLNPCTVPLQIWWGRDSESDGCDHEWRNVARASGAVGGSGSGGASGDGSVSQW